MDEHVFVFLCNYLKIAFTFLEVWKYKYAEISKKEETKGIYILRWIDTNM